MIPVSPEDSLYTVIKTAVENADVDAEMRVLEVHPTAYSKINTPSALRVGNCESEFAPFGEQVKELDAHIMLQILQKVEDSEKASDYPPARNLVRAIAIEVIKVLLKNTSLNGTCCDLEILKSFRGWAKFDGLTYAVCLIPLRINPTGKYAQ